MRLVRVAISVVLLAGGLFCGHAGGVLLLIPVSGRYHEVATYLLIAFGAGLLGASIVLVAAGLIAVREGGDARPLALAAVLAPVTMFPFGWLTGERTGLLLNLGLGAGAVLAMLRYLRAAGLR